MDKSSAIRPPSGLLCQSAQRRDRRPAGQSSRLGSRVVRAEPIAPREIRVLDDDTIHAHGHTYRLVDFDAPETERARCEAERVLGQRAFKGSKKLNVLGSSRARVRIARRSPRAELRRSLGHHKTRRARQIGISMTSGGIGKNELSANDTAPMTHDAYATMRTACPPRR